jgi:thiamine transport system permease protein
MFTDKTKNLTNFGYGITIFFFLTIIFLPTVFILKYFTNFKIFSDPIVLRAVISSFAIGSIVTFLNLLFGIPLAWVLTRSRRKFVKYIDNLVDLSLVMPTAALGFSIYLYWGANFGISGLLGLQNGLISRGPLMIMLLHLVFTLPYMIRSVAAAITQISASHEEAAITLGANPFTFFRTIAMPLFRDGVINGSILSFTRSLSETGATMMVAGAFATAPILIINLKDQGNLPAAAGASVVLIISALMMLVLSKVLLGRKKINISHVYPNFEKMVSNLGWLKNILIFAFFFLFIFLPTVHIVFYNLTNFKIPELVFFIRSLIFSLSLAVLATFINLLFAVPLSYLIARNRFRLGKLMDSLSEVVLLMPTSALGLSIALFWRQFLPSELLILLLAHLSFTFPLLIKPITSAFKEVSGSQEEAAYCLGASVKKMFLSVMLPQIKPAIIAGAIMAFMRSLSETGATLAVTRNIKTISVLIVDLFKANKMEEAAFACTVLFIIAFVFLLILKNLQSSKSISNEK